MEYEDYLLKEIDTDQVICPTCEGNEHHGLCGQWREVEGDEIFVACPHCKGKGQGTYKELGL